jgi:hypothetical protein
MATYTEDFAGAAADLAAPWVQWKNATPMRRNGSGVAVPNVANSDSGAFYNDSTGNDQYSQIVPQFNGPANGSRYIYLMLRGPSAADQYNTGVWYWFWSDGGSDTQVLRATAGAGSLSNLATDNTFTFSSGDTLKFEIVGTALKVYKNGSLHSALNATDGNIAGGKPGFGLWGGGPPTADNWEGGDVAVAGGQPISKRHGGVPFMSLPGRGNVW